MIDPTSVATLARALVYTGLEPNSEQALIRAARALAPLRDDQHRLGNHAQRLYGLRLMGPSIFDTVRLSDDLLAGLAAAGATAEELKGLIVYKRLEALS